ncbi:MAG: DUF977 family protein [Patescibacteria group bacterium]
MALIFFGLVLAYAIWLIVGKKKQFDTDLEGNPLLPEAIARRRENLERIMALAGNSPRITNDDVQRVLGVSDATATRYLSYLVDLGKLSRIGERGQQVYYQLPPK